MLRQFHKQYREVMLEIFTVMDAVAEVGRVLAWGSLSCKCENLRRGRRIIQDYAVIKNAAGD